EKPDHPLIPLSRKAEPLLPTEFERLRELWASRKAANEAQWHEFFLLVAAVLRHARISDGFIRDDLVNGYFCDRVLRGRGEAVPVSEHALISWFQNYQSDQINKEHHSPNSWEETSRHMPTELQSEAIDADAPLFRRQRVPKVAEFVRGLSEEERLLLRFAYCDDESVLSVEQRYQIQSAHYRAKRLGITLSKRVSAADWGNTKIGRLVGELGVDIDRTMSTDITQILRLLCEYASKTQEAGK
ncbi:MAG: hypothetical protein ACP5RC_06590, partial [Halothiobacillaceae bacterium]